MSAGRTVARALAASLLLTPLIAGGCRNDGYKECDTEDAYADNASLATAHVLHADSFDAAGIWQDTELTLCAGDEDWWGFEASAGQILDVVVDFEHALGDLQMQLLDASGGTIHQALSITDGEYARHTFLQDGTYYVRIFGQSAATENAYGLSLALTGEACARDGLEPNDNAVQAPLLSAGQQTGLTVCYGEDDWYRIAAADGQVIVANASFDTSIAELDLTLYRQTADGRLAWLAGSSGTELGEELVQRVSGVGPFLLQVARGLETVNATYDLDLDITGEACKADTLEPNDGYYDASPIASGDLLTDMSLCVGDRDWYGIDVHNGELISVDLDFVHADADLGLQLYQLHADGTVSWRATSDTLSDGEAIKYRPFESGSFLIHVFPSRGAVQGEYDLSVDISGAACVDDAYEPNNAFSEAKELEPGSFSDMTLCVGDEDWYRVDVDNGQVLDLSIAFSHADNDLAIDVFKLNADGSHTGRISANTLTDNESITYRPFDSGTFLVRVRRVRGSMVATYDLDLSVTGEACTPDMHEPNDGYPEAVAITPGTYAGQTLCVGDADWYKVDVDNGQVLEVDLSFVHAENDLGVTIYKQNADGTISGRTSSNSLTDGESVRYLPFDSGTFLVYVYRTRGTQLATYDMTIGVAGEACIEDAHEPNDSHSEARPIADGTYPAQTLCVGDADWYTVDLENGQLLTASISFTHADNDLGINIYKLNSDGTISSRASSNTLTDDETIAYRPYDAGTFVVYVYRTRGTQVATYALDIAVSGSACLEDAFEPNDAYTEAAPLSPGDYAGMTLCVGDSDWYEVALVNGQLLDFQLSFTHAENDLGARVYKLDDDGTIAIRATTDSLTDNEWLQYQPYDDGRFLVNVYRSRGTSVADYDMSMQISGSGCTPDSFEPNDHWLQATALPVGVPHSGLTSCVGDDDWYTIGTLEAAQVVVARATFTHADNDLALRVYVLNSDNSVTEVVAADSLSDDESAVYTVPSHYAGRPYLVRVHRSRGTVLGAYALRVDVN